MKHKRSNKKPNFTPGQPPCAAALNSLGGSSRVFLSSAKIHTNYEELKIPLMTRKLRFLRQTDSLFFGAVKKVSKKTVPLKTALESLRTVEVQRWN